MNKSKHITFRCTQDQYKEIKASAGKNLSAYIVSNLCQRVYKESSDPSRKLNTELLRQYKEKVAEIEELLFL